MPPVVIDLKQTDDVRDAILQAVETLAAGKLIALPTETVYGIAASALNNDAIQRLYELKGRPEEKPFAFAIKSADDALDYVPQMSALQRRLARRCWPGPVTFVYDLHPDSVVHRLPELVKEPLLERGTIGLRVPAHEISLEVLRLCAGPLVLTSANLSGQADATDGNQVVEELGQGVDLILNDGPSKLGQPSTVAKVQNDSIQILREGVVDTKTLNSISNILIMIVCTGNTCRSPMGEALMRKRIAESMGISEAELAKRGIQIVSAGIAAMPGGLASPQSVEVMERMGMDIEDHNSQPVTPHLVQFADVILTMTERHRHALVSHWPSAASRTFTLRRDQGDVSDPIGMPVEHYQACADQIDENVKAWVDFLKDKGTFG
jgi:protein-tyrosine phosphatase